MFTNFAILCVLTTQPTIEDVRARTRSLLESLCGARCDVIDVAIETKPGATPAGTEPGFDDSAASRRVPSSIRLTILFDARLEAPVRKFVADRVRHRISELGLPVSVVEQNVPFPTLPVEEARAPRVEEAPERPVPQAPQPAPPIVIAPPAQAPPVAPQLGDVFWLRLAESVPLLLLAAILAIVVLRLVARMENLAGPWAPEPEPAGEAARPAVTVLPPPASDELVGELRTHRPSTRRVFRSLIVRGEHDVVAKSVALLGEFVVRDLAHDPMARTALPSLGEKTLDVLRAPLDADERDELLRRIRAELEADRLAHLGEPRDPELDELFGYSPEVFVALAARLDTRLRSILLRHAPEHLVEVYLSSLGEAQRRELLRELFLGAPTQPKEVRRLAEALREHGESARMEGEETTRIIGLLDVLPRAEQDAFAAEITSRRPALLTAGLPIESQLLRAPPAALEETWSRVPVERWVVYLRTATDEIRERLLASCPTRVRPVVDEELSLAVAVDPERAAEARREIIRAVMEAEGRASSIRAVSRDGR
ncbi:MAG: hypothetical protein HY791_01815 [Deltaproteobacteria bacterium]|nr:hypothetical protein [Deltaproteobacteria bacterium]